MKIYTRTGDHGTTGLATGERVQKNSARIAAIGEVDELNALVGLARVHAPAALDALLEKIQNKLFVVGAELATPDGPLRENAPHITERDIACLEQAIDELSEGMPPLTQFILPGGSALAAALHQCRAVARRAERAGVALAYPRTYEGEGARVADPSHENILKFLNRVSDFFFTAARWANAQSGVPDVFWKK